MKIIRRIKVEPPGATMPTQIRLKGKWLEEAGFKPGDYVSVNIGHGELIIKREVGGKPNPQSSFTAQ